MANKYFTTSEVNTPIIIFVQVWCLPLTENDLVSPFRNSFITFQKSRELFFKLSQLAKKSENKFSKTVK